jgi:hypothetical protein
VISNIVLGTVANMSGRKPKATGPEIEYLAFMIATVLVLFRCTDNGYKEEWAPSDLALITNAHPIFGADLGHIEIFVDPVALHQGLHILGGALEKATGEKVSIIQKKSADGTGETEAAEFLQLPAIATGRRLKFIGLRGEDPDAVLHMQKHEVLGQIVAMKDCVMRVAKYETSSMAFRRENFIHSYFVISAFATYFFDNVMKLQPENEAGGGNLSKKSRVIVNVAFNYAVIKKAAQGVQGRQEWRDDATVKYLEFSTGWIQNFLKRAKMRRRKITTDDKVLLSEQEVNDRMRVGQALFVAGHYIRKWVWNMDETAYTYGIGPTHLFVPADASRASNVAGSDAKVRITAVVCVNGEGTFPPLMLNLKHSVDSGTRADQTGMRVIPLLHAREGFKEADEWELKVWERELTIVCAFKEYRDKFHEYHGPLHQGAAPGKFRPPKASLDQSMDDVLKLFAMEFKDPTFKEGIQRSFDRTGICPTPALGGEGESQFAKYMAAKIGGSVPLVPTGTVEAEWQGAAADEQDEATEALLALYGFLDGDLVLDGGGGEEGNEEEENEDDEEDDD